MGVGDKAGTYRALDRETGEVLWERHLTEGGLQGGVMASAAVADGTIYVASNEASQDAVLFALDADTGEEVWRTEVGAHVTGPVTWANDVLYLADDAGGVAAYAAEERRLWHTRWMPARQRRRRRTQIRRLGLVAGSCARRPERRHRRVRLPGGGGDGGDRAAAAATATGPTAPPSTVATPRRGASAGGVGPGSRIGDKPRSRSRSGRPRGPGAHARLGDG